MRVTTRVSDLKWREGSPEISWIYGLKHISLTHSAPAGHALVLKDGSGIVLVEDLKGSQKDNALVLNADGSIRFRIKNPLTYRDDDRFYYASFEGDDLVIILASAAGDRACTIEQRTGAIVRCHETR